MLFNTNVNFSTNKLLRNIFSPSDFCSVKKSGLVLLSNVILIYYLIINVNNKRLSWKVQIRKLRILVDTVKEKELNQSRTLIKVAQLEGRVLFYFELVVSYFVLTRIKYSFDSVCNFFQSFLNFYEKKSRLLHSCKVFHSYCIQWCYFRCFCGVTKTTWQETLLRAVVRITLQTIVIK